MDLLWKLEAFQSFWEFRTSLFMSGTSTLETQSVSQPIWELNSCTFCASPEVIFHAGRLSGIYHVTWSWKPGALRTHYGVFVVFCDPWKYFVVSSSLSLWDLNRVSPICGTVVETRFPVVPELTTCLPLWGSADMVSLIAETKSCILLRCSSALPLFFQERFNAFALPAFL